MTLTYRTVMKSALGIAFATVLVASCGDTVYLLDVTVKGGEAASRRTLTIGRRDAPPFRINNGVAETFLEVCTSSRERFLHGPVPILVKDDEGTTGMFSLEPLACANSRTSGRREMIYLVLEDDGTLITDLASGHADVWAACSTLEPGASCQHGEDF